MKLSRTVEYAVQAVLQLAQHDGGMPIPCSRLAAVGQMPERFLLQILRSLVTHGILTSTRGVDGGYSLGRNVADISLLEVIEAVDGPLQPTVASGPGMPDEARRRLGETLTEVTAGMRRQLNAVKLIHLLPPAP